MESFNELLIKAEAAHGHLCAGQILGVRMALLGLDRLGIQDPKGADRKRLVTYVEIDRCATDAIGLVTGCSLGKRTLKFRDWGKMAATFVDLTTENGLRIVALEDSRELARQLYPQIESQSQQQMLAYRELSNAQLFHEQRVRVTVGPGELPGSKGRRLPCPRCGEGVNFGRFVEVEGQFLCLSCAQPGLRYWTPET
jgi:formylmethanofuran dehydrogenase subunit E